MMFSRRIGNAISAITFTISLLVKLAILTIVAIPVMAESINIGRSDVELIVPSGYSAAVKAPLVILLHGYTASGATQEGYLRFSELVDEYNFFLLTPDGTAEELGDNNPFWNATAACCDFYGTEVDDSIYLVNLIEEMQLNYNVDENRIFLVGHSNGGFMAHRLAYDHPEKIAAIASLAGASLLEMPEPTPERPVSILQIHGTADDTIAYDGGFIFSNEYPGANDSLEKWIDHNGATLDKTELQERMDLDVAIAGSETIATQFDSNGTVELWTIEGGGHGPLFTADFKRNVIEWLYDHPKNTAPSVLLGYADDVQKMYIAYYGRAGDPAGIAFWAGKLEAQAGNLTSIIEFFGNSEEYDNRFSSRESSQLVENIYQQLFGHSADPTGLNFYTARLDSGDYTLASIALEIANGIQVDTEDETIYNNKLTVANRFTSVVEESKVVYDADDLDAVVALLASVGSASDLTEFLREVSAQVSLME